jgi:hypothetical protein
MEREGGREGRGDESMYAPSYALMMERRRRIFQLNYLSCVGLNNDAVHEV